MDLGGPSMQQQQMYPPQPTSQTPVQGGGSMDLLGEGLDSLVSICTSSKKSQSPITGAQQINTEILVCVSAKVAHVTRPTYNHGSNIHNIIYLLFDNLDNCHLDLLSSKIMICIIWVFVSAWWTCSEWGFFRGTWWYIWNANSTILCASTRSEYRYIILVVTKTFKILRSVGQVVCENI